MNDSKNALLARTCTRALQQFLCFCFHNLHRFSCNPLYFNHLPPIFGQFLTQSKAQQPHLYAITWHLPQHNSLTYNPSPHLLPLFWWRLWKQKVITPWCVRTHARGFFWNVKMSIHISPSSLVAYFTNPAALSIKLYSALSPSPSHSTIIAFSIIPNRLLDPEQISLDCWAYGLSFAFGVAGYIDNQRETRCQQGNERSQEVILSITRVTITV